MICPWCEKVLPMLVKHPMPDDDYVEVCINCSLEAEEKKEKRYSRPKPKPRTTQLT